ncbi:ribosomal protein S18-alanine N-acetyltransferase [Angustibacter luteus]|uniref:Ribosomal protein S18-alanine N-acetyltransferase n=1 Tax=Angustibacter luteus TaxID=658456 RepID=A0ABW1JGD8_9ACTN
MTGPGPDPRAPSVRRMRWWDVEALLPLEDALFAHEAWSAETFWAELAQSGPSGQRDYLVLEGLKGPEGLDGYAGVSVAGGVADVMTVAVAPTRQGQGLGRLLVQQLVALAEGRGAARMMLEVRADNAAAQRVYHGVGFERIAVRRDYYRTPDGPADAWVMQLRLASTGDRDER